MPNKKLAAFFERMNVQLTYGDVRMATAYSEILPHQADVTSWFSRRVPLRIPIASSAMDTVTGDKMAIAMASQGGLGVIHKNMSPEDQARQVKRVKFHLHGRIDTPICVTQTQTLAEIEAMRVERRFKFHSLPVVDENGIFVGLLTESDFRFAESREVTAEDAMTRRSDDFLFGEHTMSSEEAYRAMQKRKKNVIPLLDKSGKVAGMYIFSDLERIRSGSMHNVDARGHLVAAAAVGAGVDALARAELLAQANCDVFVIDTAHGDSKNVFDTIEALKRSYPEVDVVAGNVSSGESVKRLIKAGADGILVGQGPGSICTTRVVAGIGRPQVSAVYECVKAAEGSGVPICADGGIQHPGDITIALAVGARSVMLGSVLAGTDKSPGEVVQHGLTQVKVYRGMGSISAMRDRAESRSRYGQAGVELNKLVPEGVEGTVPYIGPLEDVLRQFVGGVQAGMAYVGQPTLEALRQNAEIFRITNAGLAESHPHDLQVT